MRKCQHTHVSWESCQNRPNTIDFVHYGETLQRHKTNSPSGTGS